MEIRVCRAAAFGASQRVQPMNKIAALIALGAGGAFFAVELAIPYRPALPFADLALTSLLAPRQAKAREAVMRLMFNPASAEFSELRSVDIGVEGYVCGRVKGRDRQGAYAGDRAFVYTVANDFARIDDDGRIAMPHVAYQPCPVPQDGSPAPKPAVSPQTIALAKGVVASLPKADPQDLTTLQQTLLPGGPGAASPAPSSGGRPTPPSEAAAAPRAGSGVETGDDEQAWRSDQPPAAWPRFPLDHPLAKPAAKRSAADAIAFAADVEARWTKAKAGQGRTGEAGARPTAAEIEEALRALLATDPNGPDFPRAWALFVELRQIDREATAG
ncbi:hypothetical protein DB459_01085 [Bradyrhizobium sp. WD16]|nr:hypothetical protein DB459_01085 [Bradyrhizobium sp. WD16]